MSFAVTLLGVRLVGFGFVVFWTVNQFIWWKLPLVGFMAILVGMQVQRVRRQALRDKALREGIHAGTA